MVDKRPMDNLVPITVGVAGGLAGTMASTAISKSLTKDEVKAPKDISFFKKAYTVDLGLGVVTSVLGLFVRQDKLRKGLYAAGGTLGLNGVKDMILDLTAEDANKTKTGRPRAPQDVVEVVAAGNAMARQAMARQFAHARRLPSARSDITDVRRSAPALF